MVARQHLASFVLDRFPGGAPGDLPVQDYSRMKHGDLPATHALADRLSEDLLAAFPVLSDPSQRISLPVAYVAVFPASGHVALRVAERLRAARSGAPAVWSEGDAGVRWVRIAKDAVTTIDYASSGEQARREQMARLGFSLDTPVDGDVVLLVDDVRITGLAEDTAVAALLEASAPARLITAYIAEAGPRLRRDPSVELRLNQAAIREPEQLLPAMRNGAFALTIRYLKWFLASPGAERLAGELPADVASEMLDGAVASGFEAEPLYSRGLAALRQRVGA
ncbi:MAG: phosphoribosyltransferase family protein [Arthrobacter sp.]|jgi:hypothetical protein|nr:phosphoribosyltransferase family protein [Arthrobacter sp.]